MCDEILDAAAFEVPAEAESFDEPTGDFGNPFSEDATSGPFVPATPPRFPRIAETAKHPQSLETPRVAAPDIDPDPDRADSAGATAQAAAAQVSAPRLAPLPKAAPTQPARGGNPRQAAPAPEAQAKGKRRRPGRPTASADQVLTDNWAAFRSLPAFEQLSVAASFLGAISMIFPWQTVLGSEEIGLFCGALALLPLGAAGLVIWLRASGNLRGFGPEQLGIIQILSGLSLLAYCAFFFHRTLNAGIYRSVLGATNLHVSSPEFGCVSCGLAAIGLAAGGGWAYLEERGFA